MSSCLQVTVQYGLSEDVSIRLTLPGNQLLQLFGSNQCGVLPLEQRHLNWPPLSGNSPVKIKTGSGACPVFWVVIVITGAAQVPLAWIPAT